MSLVLQLQEAAMDPTVSVTDVLRKAYMVATKLDVPDFVSWCQRELRGYDSADVPPYRSLKGEVRARSPHSGFIPMRIADPRLSDLLATRPILDGVGEISHLLEQEGDIVVYPFNEAVLEHLFADHEMYQLGFLPMVMLPKTALFGILESVRNIALEWSLRLEKDGILGQGLTFTPQERQMAAGHTYHIQNFTGVLGDVNTQSLQVGDYNSVMHALENSGVPATEREELKSIVEALPTADPTTKRNLIQRGGDWLMRNAPSIGTLSQAIRGWFPKDLG